MKTRNPFSMSSLSRLSLQSTALRPRQWHNATVECGASIRPYLFSRPASRSTPTHQSIPHNSRSFTTKRRISTPLSRRNTSTTATTPSASPSRIVRPLVPPPKEGSGPLLSRRPDRELPDLPRRGTWMFTLPFFAVLVGLSSFAIFNYQKSSSSTVNAILYALRTNEHARELLGDEIYFASKIPWIRGELAPLQGTIDITFWVKGTKNEAQVKFVSIRKKRDGFFETLEWSLKTKDGKVVQLLDMEGAVDPMAGAQV